MFLLSSLVQVIVVMAAFVIFTKNKQIKITQYIAMKLMEVKKHNYLYVIIIITCKLGNFPDNKAPDNLCLVCEFNANYTSIGLSGTGKFLFFYFINIYKYLLGNN